MNPGEQFSEARIMEQLDRILSVPSFRNSGILSGFLKFVVGESLAGRAKELKEYSIGVTVLSRNSNFNPQIDSIVRIHAGRLRRALNEYYFDSGSNDPIRIDIPKGSYAPHFGPNQKNETPGIKEKIRVPRSRPTVAVLPFRNLSMDSSRDFFADGLGEQLSSELTWFDDLSVISYFSSRNAVGKTSDIMKAASLLGAKYVVTGSIQHDETHLRIHAQLIQGENGEQLWSKSFEKDNSAASLIEIQNEIVRSILKAIGGYYGAIFRDVMNSPINGKSNGVNGIEVYDAIFWYYYYQKVTSLEVFEKTINALENAVKADPNYALAWAVLGELYMDDKAHEFRKGANQKEEALKCALRAVSIDPNCQHAYQALAWIYLFYHDKEEVLKAADKCISINPNASGMVGAMGFGYVCAGEFDTGFEILNDSIANNPYCPWWFYMGFFLVCLYRKEHLKALHWAERIFTPELFWDPLLKAVAFGHLNRPEEAFRNLKLLNELIPGITIDQVEEIIESFLLSNELNIELLDGLRKAGLGQVSQKSGIEL